jgi:hypothetical protein
MQLTPNDLDALKRAIKWGEAFQRREPQLKLMPEQMSIEGSPEWIELATYFAAKAQSQTLGLYPWQCEPVHVHDDGVVDVSCYGRRSDEVALLRKMLALGVSIFEPDPPAAIAKAERERAA